MVSISLLELEFVSLLRADISMGGTVLVMLKNWRNKQYFSKYLDAVLWAFPLLRKAFKLIPGTFARILLSKSFVRSNRMSYFKAWLFQTGRIIIDTLSVTGSIVDRIRILKKISEQISSVNQKTVFTSSSTLNNKRSSSSRGFVVLQRISVNQKSECWDPIGGLDGLKTCLSKEIVNSFVCNMFSRWCIRIFLIIWWWWFITIKGNASIIGFRWSSGHFRTFG